MGTVERQSVRLPNFCSPAHALTFLLIGFGLAAALVLGSASPGTDLATSFVLHGLFVQAIILATLGLLCQLRFRLEQLHSNWAFLLAFLLAPALSGLFSLAIVVGFPLLLDSSDTSFFVLSNVLIAALCSLFFVRYLAVQSVWKQRVAAESHARLDALQARIQPHFLFNALNTIAELVHSRPEQAEEALLDLSDLLRTGLRSEARDTLQEEFELVRGYLRIESLRLGERLKVDWSIDDSVDRTTEIPALLVQPLVENAVLHGIAPRSDGGTLVIRLEPARFGRARIIVENPLPSSDQPRRQGNRTALENIRQRLALAYEEGASLKTEQTDTLFRAVLTLPLKTVLAE